MQMADELIRLDTTIIGIDNLINKASTVEETKVLFTAKDVIYSQQRYFTDVQPVIHAHWRVAKSSEGLPTNRFVCSECMGLVQISTYCYHCMFNYCPNCGARMDGENT